MVLMPYGVGAIASFTLLYTLQFHGPCCRW